MPYYDNTLPRKRSCCGNRTARSACGKYRLHFGLLPECGQLYTYRSGHCGYHSVGVDCNVIASERIKDEFKKGKTIDGAIDSGFKNALSAIIDGNVTIIIVSIVLMGAFGTPDNIIAKLFSPIMSLLGSSITGSIYSFGYTLLVGVIFNLIMGVLASKYMLKSISQLKFMRKPQFYGGEKNA